MRSMKIAMFLSVVDGKVSRDDGVSFIEDQDSFARNLLNSLNDESKLKLIKEIGKFIVYVIDGLSSVQTERDRNNLVAVGETPAVTSNELIKYRTHDLNIFLDQYRVRVLQF